MDENRILKEKLAEANRQKLERENTELKRKYEEYERQQRGEGSSNPYRKRLFPLSSGSGAGSMQRSDSWQSRGNYAHRTAYDTPPSGR